MKFGVSIRQAPKAFTDAALKCSEIDYVEIASEYFLYRNDYISRKTLETIFSQKEVASHGYSLSLLDPTVWKEDRLTPYKKFLKEYPLLNLSDHYAISSWNGKNLGSLTPAPVCDAATLLIKKRLGLIDKELQIPFLLENVASPFLLDKKQNSFVDQFPEVLKDSKAKMLLDLSNLVANEINFGISADQELEKLTHVEIGEIHLAGGHIDRGFYRDSHSDDILPRSWELLKKISPYLNDETLILVEREQNHPPFEETMKEVNLAKRTLGL